jgi:hypothetical protein
MTWCAQVFAARIKSFEAGQFRRCAPILARTIIF